MDAPECAEGRVDDYVDSDGDDGGDALQEVEDEGELSGEDEELWGLVVGGALKLRRCCPAPSTSTPNNCF
jgi:hypothetical protein